MDLRIEAESRVLRQQQQKLSHRERQNGTQFRGKRPRYQVVIDTTGTTENATPRIAALAEIDFKLNGSRARANSGEFVAPRWIPDEEASNCMACSTPFDWWTRRHHCRNCGRIFCNQCSYYRSLLPIEFGLRDPQRVCKVCHDLLQPLQTSLTNDIANHQRTNNVDIVSNGVRRYLNFPISMTLGSEIRKAAYSTYNLFSQNYWIQDRTVPLGLLESARGLAFITVAKGGWMIAPRFGTGLVVARLRNGDWSAPTAIGLLGISYGALIGADVTDYVVILNSDDAVSAFSGSGLVTVGAGLDVAVGPLGRNGSADMNIGDLGCAAAYSYSHSRGLYAGVSLEGSVIFSRSDVNHRFYGRVVSPQDILRGMLPPPRAARPLYEALEQALSALPQPTYGGLALAVLGPSSQNAGKHSKVGLMPPTAAVGVTYQQTQGPARSQSSIRGGVHNVSSFESASTRGSLGDSDTSVGRGGYTSHSAIQGPVQNQNLKVD